MKVDLKKYVEQLRNYSCTNTKIGSSKDKLADGREVGTGTKARSNVRRRKRSGDRFKKNGQFRSVVHEQKFWRSVGPDELGCVLLN